MIITLTPNPALDITYAVETLTLGDSHRVGSVSERAGGKGLNVAGVLVSMGRAAVAVAPVGEGDGEAFAQDLEERGVSHRLVTSPSATRRSVAVVEAGGRATLLNEPGTNQPQDVWERVAAGVADLAPRASVLTVSGSLPPGTDADLVARLTGLAHEAGLRVVLDVSGIPLLRALTVRPDLVKPNRAEAARTLLDLRREPTTRAGAGAGVGCGGRGEALSTVAAARALVAEGAQAAVVTDGEAGLVAVHDGVALRARLARPLAGNPTGAGDALTASLAADLDDLAVLPVGPDAWAAVLARGVAWSAAAVLQPVAGAVDPADVERLLPTVEIEEMHP
jgi:tagatose 6-phosphate kinase